MHAPDLVNLKGVCRHILFRRIFVFGRCSRPLSQSRAHRPPSASRASARALTTMSTSPPMAHHDCQYLGNGTRSYRPSQQKIESRPGLDSISRCEGLYDRASIARYGPSSDGGDRRWCRRGPRRPPTPPITPSILRTDPYCRSASAAGRRAAHRSAYGDRFDNVIDDVDRRRRCRGPRRPPMPPKMLSDRRTGRYCRPTSAAGRGDADRSADGGRFGP